MESTIQLQPLDNNWRGDYRYTVYKHQLIAPDGSVYTRPFIVIKNAYGAIVRFTDLHNYASIFAGKIFVPINADAIKKLFYIYKLLNYALIERYDEYDAEHIFDISREMLEQFFTTTRQQSRASVDSEVSRASSSAYRRLRSSFAIYAENSESECY